MATKIGYEKHLDPKSLPTLQDIDNFYESEAWQNFKQVISKLHNGAERFTSDGYVNSTAIPGIRSYRHRSMLFPLLNDGTVCETTMKAQETMEAAMKKLEIAAKQYFPTHAVKVYRKRHHQYELTDEGKAVDTNTLDSQELMNWWMRQGKWVKLTGKIVRIDYSFKVFYQSDRRYDPYKHTR